MEKNHDLKYLHILPANADTSYWFVKTIQKSPDAYEHSFLIAANEKTVLNRCPILLEFYDSLNFLVGGTSGNEWRRRSKKLKTLFNEASFLIFHGLNFDTLRLDKTLYKKKKLIQKSIYIAQRSEFFFDPVSKEKKAKKDLLESKILSIMKAVLKICYSDESLVEKLAKKLDMSAEEFVYTPYVTNPEFILESKKILSREPEEKEEDLYISFFDFEENFLDEETEETPIRFLLDFSVSGFDSLRAILIELQPVLENQIKLTIPNSIWINAIPTTRFSFSRKERMILNILGKNKVEFKNASFSIENYYSYLEEIDIIVLFTKAILNPIYLYASILANKVFVISKNHFLYGFVEQSGCMIIPLEDLSSLSLEEITPPEEYDLQERATYLKKYFIINNFLPYWEDLFEKLG